MNQFVCNRFTLLAATLLLGGLLLSPATANAAQNQALGSIAGVLADLNDSNTVDIASTTLSLSKAAFLTDGTPLLGNGTETLPRGTRLHFLIYVNNPTVFNIDDVRVTDQLAGFTYVTLANGGVLREANVLNACAAATCTSGVGGEESAILSAVLGTADKTEGPDADSLSYDGGTTTVSAGATTNGTSITANATSAWGMVFEVTIN